MNSLPFGQLKSLEKILIGVQYDTVNPDFRRGSVWIAQAAARSDRSLRTAAFFFAGGVIRDGGRPVYTSF